MTQTQQYLGRVIKRLRSYDTITFPQERELPLFYVNGKLSCLLIAFLTDEIGRERLRYRFKKPSKFKSHMFNQHDLVWYYFLAINGKKQLLYRVSAQTIAVSLTQISVNDDFSCKYPIEFVLNLNKDGRGNFKPKTQLRDKNGLFIKGVKGGDIYENTSNKRVRSVQKDRW